MMNSSHKFTRIACSICLLVSLHWTTDAAASGHVILQSVTSTHGEEENDAVWLSTVVGDVNGDGVDDLAVADAYHSVPTLHAGKVYFIFGAVSLWPMGSSLAEADASYHGEAESDVAGTSLDGAGDLDGDGYDDIILGAPDNDDAGSSAGKVYVIYGQTSLWYPDESLSVVDSSFVGENPGDAIGDAVAGVGDVNGDGLDDVALSSTALGITYVFFGAETRVTAGTSVSGAAASFVGESGEGAGNPLAGGDDVNGDGFDDFLVGSYGYDHMQGRVRIVLGKATGWTTMSPPAEADAYYTGENQGDEFGSFMAMVGDMNGDGLSDMAFGAPHYSVGGNDTGKVYILFGRDQGWAALGDIGVEADVVFVGEAGGDEAGWVGAAGDVNDDSFADLLVGAPGNDEAGYNSGQAYLLMGRGGDWPSGPTLTESDASFLGEHTQDLLGWQPNGGDLDGDGFSDILVSASSNDTFGLDTGLIYLIRGFECWDIDWDGYDSCSGDCDDNRDLTYPDAPELCDGEDNDCDGTVDEGTDVDDDGDGFTECEGDCNDLDASKYPGAAEACNGEDDDCDGALPADESDLDGDGIMACEGDCDDEEQATHPGAPELCDGSDNDCDGVVPDSESDGDSDGMMICEGDCDDEDEDIHDGAEEIPYDGVDQDCDGEDLADLDGDTYDAVEAGGDDCDDEDGSIHPGADEECGDDVDNDCDGEIDEGCGDDDDSADDDDSTPDDDDSALDDDDSTPDDDDSTPLDDGSSPEACECDLADSGRPTRGLQLLLLGLAFAARRISRLRA
jgi:hypothetical protein